MNGWLSSSSYRTVLWTLKYVGGLSTEAGLGRQVPSIREREDNRREAENKRTDATAPWGAIAL